jgi:MYXO-CTERM domain-containing protein
MEHGSDRLQRHPRRIGWPINNKFHRRLLAMRHIVVLSLPLLATLLLASATDAATLYVSPTGTSTAACTRKAPCDLTTGASTAIAGDTVILMDGVYKTALDVANSGTESAWITFQADDCATPIIEGQGIETATGVDKVDQPTGVGSSTATYVRFIGLVSRGWNTGFGNGWTGTDTTNSNGHFEYKYCIGDGNGRTGFTFYSAAGLQVRNCIASHNGSSVLHSWSSGIALYQAQGTDNLVEGSVAFENMDAQQRTDGSGFIVDAYSNDAAFINNIGFGNGGSCLRLTLSSGTKFINNTCYHNARDLEDKGPSNPGELYFTGSGNSPTTQNITFMNNILVATGVGPGAGVVYNQPSSGWSNNIVTKNAVSFFTAPEGTNPDFTLTSSATELIGMGATGDWVPAADIGFDPKCIVKQAPTMIGDYPAASWWEYSVDIDYIKKIGGVAKCFRPKTRPETPDIGAYANGSVEAVSTCTPTTPSTGGSTGKTSGSSADNSGGCGCRLSDRPSRSAALGVLGLLGLVVLRRRRWQTA